MKRIAIGHPYVTTQTQQNFITFSLYNIMLNMVLGQPNLLLSIISPIGIFGNLIWPNIICELSEIQTLNSFNIYFMSKNIVWELFLDNYLPTYYIVCHSYDTIKTIDAKRVGLRLPIRNVSKLLIWEFNKPMFFNWLAGCHQSINWSR